MTKLRLGPDLSIPEDVVTSTVVVYGGKGMGKTNLGSVLVEELTKARLRWAVLDPMGVWWGSRHSKDGKGPGIECVILGGAHGDIPIAPTGGAVVADLVVDESANTIIDFSRHKNGTMWTGGERVRFVTDYTLRLFQRQGELVGGRRREPLMQILDESARYIPQVIPSGAIDLARCVGAWEQVCEEGRNIGLGVTFLTQRSARMNKSVSELADVMVAFRTVGPRSLDAIMDWLGEHVEKSKVRDLAVQVRELNVGQALVVSPGWLRVEKVVQVRERETFDSSATPKPGERPQRVSGQAAKPDLAKYEARMAETIEKAKADDPKELRKRITELERAVSRPPANELSGQLKAEYQRGYFEGRGVGQAEQGKKHLYIMRNVAADFRSIASGMAKVVEEAHRAAQGTENAVVILEGSEAERTGGARRVPPSEVGPPVRAVGQSSRAPARPIAPSSPLDSDLPKGQQKLVDAAARLASMGIQAPTRTQLAALAPMSPTSSTTDQHFGTLIKSGLLETAVEAGRVRLTDAGRAVAAPVTTPPTLDEYHDAWRALLSGSQVKLFNAMVQSKRTTEFRAALAEAAGISSTSSTTDAAFGWLLGLELLTVAGVGLVKGGPTMFPEGLD